MLFDPEDGMTLEQSIEIAMRRRPDLKARLEAVAQATGRTSYEIILECRLRFLEDMKDPAKAAAYRAELDREFAPFGPDPLLKKEGP
jgi:predicted DNA-binding protein